jgi:hypothetical protein
MGKFADIINRPWVDMTLYPESIPHLLHQDLAYLWVLEKQADLRPKIWGERLEAWRCLLELLFIGELDVRDEPIKEPLIQYTSPHGITKVSWVVIRGGEEMVGVLSPVVILRPLPDFTADDLAKWKQWLADKRRPGEFPFYIQLAIKELKEGGQQDSFRSRLAAILEKEFAPGQANNPPHNAFGARISIPMLRQFLWTQRPGQPPTIDQVDVLVRRGGDGGDHVYVPRCKTCSHILTKARSSPTIIVEGNSFRVECENPSGGHVNELDLTDFLIWMRPGNQVIVWEQDGATSIPEKGFPPKPYTQGIQVEFEWNEAQLAGERVKRYLVLQFREKELIRRKLKDILFDQVLVAGHFEKFNGLPVRPEWTDALENPHQVVVTPDPSAARVTYRDLRVKGWPMPLLWTYSGTLGVKGVSKLAVGIYPDPDEMPEGWRWYRYFLHGTERRGYRLITDSSKKILPWLIESESGKPRTLSLTDEAGAAGATYYVKDVPSPFVEEARADAFLGVDFGTTNTTIYFLPPGENAENPQPERYGLKPSLLGANAKWFAEAEGLTEVIGDFLPGFKYRGGSADPYIIPSALWKRQDQFLVRWGPEEPAQGVQALGDFKWDKEGVPNYVYRKAYLRELLLLALPQVIKNTGLHTSKVKFHLGFAFPLAFDFEARGIMQKLLDEVDALMGAATGFDFESYSINESTACVRAFGTFNPGDTFLVADMGGGTMDISFFTVRGAQANDIHQIGSVQFAGETYVRALTRKKQPNVQAQDAFRWKLKDSISTGASQSEYGSDQAAQTILHRFGGLAFEFLRTLVAAYRQDAPEQEIHLVLVGNGWHLAEALSSETKTRGAKRVFMEHYSHLLNQMDEVTLSLYLGEPLPSLPSSKHLIVIGALRNVSGPQKRKELAEEPSLSKLPAGRDFEFNTARGRVKQIRWHELVGEAFALTEFSADELRQGRSDFSLKEVPAFRDPWQPYLLGIFGAADESSIPYPDVPNLRDKVLASIQGHPPKITKGPLQIILEQRWADWLIEN